MIGAIARDDWSDSEGDIGAGEEDEDEIFDVPLAIQSMQRSDPIHQHLLHAM